MSQFHFFLSYCRSDGSEIADQIMVRLREKGYSVFSGIEAVNAGVDFAQCITNAIANCHYFVPIITEGAMKSEWVMKEIAFACSKAESRATQVIPILATTEQLDDRLWFYIGHMQQILLDRSKELSEAVDEVVRRLDMFVGYKLKSSLLYEKLSEYKKLNNHNRRAETVCDLLRLAKEKYIRTPKFSIPDLWQVCEEFLNLYQQLSTYIGGYTEESRRIARKIIAELDEMDVLLAESAYYDLSSLFRRHILFASAAIRLIYLDREIRCECADILSYGDVKNPCPISRYAEKQRIFADTYRREYPKLRNSELEEFQQTFIKETKQYIFVPSKNIHPDSLMERDVYSTLIKCGYSVDTNFSLDHYTVDLAVKKNGNHVLFIECAGDLADSPRALNRYRALESHIESIGGKFHIIRSADWAKDPQSEIRKIKAIMDSVSTCDDDLLVSIAKFIQEGNKLFDNLQKKGIAGDFPECLRESYERLKNYCIVVGADEVAAECAERIVEIRNEAGRQSTGKAESEKAEKGIKSLLGFTLEDSGKYDVFISFKSEDSDLAEKIYEYCHKRMKEPFWSKKSLPRLSKSEYSKAIDTALDNAKHFVVVLSDLKYLDAEWIQYEMDVFNNEIKEGRKKNSNFVIVATDDVYNEIIRSNKTVLDIAYRRYQIIKMSEYEGTLAQYLS